MLDRLYRLISMANRYRFGLAIGLSWWSTSIAGSDSQEPSPLAALTSKWFSPGKNRRQLSPVISAFWLKNAQTSGPAEEMFQFGMGSLE